MAEQWSPTSWRAKPVTQQAAYPDAAELQAVVAQLARLPPLVTSWEIEALKSQLAEAAAGKRFLLQGGDCAESFDDCESSCIADKLKILLQMSLVLVHGTHKRVIRVGRFAGQYAKPRSDDMERRGDGAALPAYRGDIVNRAPFDEASRTPDPQNMLRAYERSALTLNFIRALIDGGFADLHHPEYWDLGFVRHSPRAAEYQAIVESIGDSLRFMETLAGASVGQINRVDFFASHEGLQLLYEQAQTRQVPRREGWYNLATHMPWIGMRTARVGGAHVEYFRGIRNPIAVKLGPLTPPADAAPAQAGHGATEAMRAHVRALLDVLHADNEPGRLTLIHRFGVHHVAKLLPPLIEAVQATGKTVLWCCDPMHGNTQTVQVKPQADDQPPIAVKTRKFEHILGELEQAFEIHQRMGTQLGGVHFELTGENVTECTGGARGMGEADLTRAYRSHVDPRLNYEQALEMAMLIAKRAR